MAIDDHGPPTADEGDLENLFGAYIDRLNRGEELNPQEVLACHPELGERLLDCLEDYVGPSNGLAENENGVEDE